MEVWKFEGLERFRKDLEATNLVAKSFKSMSFNESLHMDFTCIEQPGLCLLIMVIGTENDASATFMSKGGSKLVISRQRDAPVTRKCKKYNGKKDQCLSYSQDCVWYLHGDMRGYCHKKAIRTGTVQYIFVPGSSHGRRRLLQGGSSGGDS